MSEQPCDLTMYHDGACPLCAREVDHYRALDVDGRIRFVDVREAEATLRAEGVEPEAALQRLHVRDAEGRWLTGAAAFVALWSALPGWRRLVPIARIPPILWLLEQGYRLTGPIRRALAPLFAERSKS